MCRVVVMLEIKIHSTDVMRAIEAYVKEQYGLDTNLDVHSEDCAISEGVVMVDYKKLDRVYKKHKNGKLVKDQNGHTITDWEKSKYINKWIAFDESCEISFHLVNEKGW